jgi:hypothetical protein
MFVLPLLLIPKLALASAAPTPKKYGAILVSMDRQAESNSLKVEAFMDEALHTDPSLTVKRSDELFGMPGDDEAMEAFKRSETGFGESKAAFDDHDFDDAERKLKATMKEYTKAAGAMTECGHLCDAIAMYAAVMHQRGEVDEARLALLNLLSLSPTYELSPKVFSKDFIGLRATVATSVNAALRGNATIKSSPGGARIYLDNSFVGYTPMALPNVAVGQHLLRIEHPGFSKWGQLVELSPEDQELNVELKPTTAWKTYDGMLDKVAPDVLRDQSDMVQKLGRSLGIERAIVGTLRSLHDTNETELLVALFEVSNGKRVAMKKVVFQGDEFGQLKEEVAHVVHGLVNTANGDVVQAKSRSSDPLEKQSGMEEWNNDDHTKASESNSNQKKHQARDPLDHVDGTEDW